jgi:hypothetical protein
VIRELKLGLIKKRWEKLKIPIDVSVALDKGNIS